MTTPYRDPALPNEDQLVLHIEHDRLVFTRHGERRAMVPFAWVASNPEHLGVLLARILLERQD